MEVSGIDWIDRALGFLPWIAGLVGRALIGAWSWIVELQAQYPQLLSFQTLFGLVGLVLAIWKWWEGREVNLFRRFERMIERYEAQLVKARSDLLDVINRPGPGLLIRLPLFLERPLKVVLARRRWHPFSLLPPSVDRQLERAILTCNRKVSAHLDRLAFFREQIASARLLQGAIAAGRATGATEEHERQRLDQEALDHFRAVLGLPGHQEDVGALELIAHQLAHLDSQGQSAVSTYLSVIGILEQQQEMPARNLLLARAKRCLAILRYPATPGVARNLLGNAIDLLTQFGPPRDRDLLELAETVHLDGIARLRLGAVVLGPNQLNLAQGHYRDLLRSLDKRQRKLFRWMFQQRKFTGHRIVELRTRAARGLAQVDHLLKLTDRYPKTVAANLARGNGAPRRNRRPPRSQQGR